ncbi:acyl-CoA dehydrogenase family protein [Streptomyces pseudovenezuelae]|uniref:Alkylation response protein AidB-like acyl-CoA dehydrogenase n=1 Tax=Streptomyces pseudovenezuelae TaxID=67350 RepID=A0ABT6LUP4_9ACTN|nr:acyl-CoA dehydrogenase family protein [Streptomyces pseudovenezuelae]MDH6219544.1 alkylation response protein AidB-like acyl-CoA dehydrogenase [Streptomyces pseudovenezuelae]
MTATPPPPAPDGQLPPMSPPVPASPVVSPWITDEGRRIRDRVRALIPLIRSQAREGEKIAALTPEVLEAINDAGVFRMSMPVEWGGYGLGARDLVEVIAALSEGDGSAGWAGFVGVGVKNVLAMDAQVVDEVRAETEDWVGPAIVGASVFATKVGTARAVDGGWMVHGKWAFGSCCKHASWALVGIEYDPAEAGSGGGRGMVALRREQYEILDDWDVMGLSGSASNSLRVQDEVFVPAHRFIDLGEFPLRLQQLHDRYTGFGYGQRGLALLLCAALANLAITLGMARGALDCFTEQANKRKPFTLPYPTIGDMASAQVAAGKALAMINVAAATIEGAADQIDARTTEGLDFTPPEESEISLSIAYAANLCEDAINLLQKTIGSSTVSLSNPIQRFVRDARVLTSHGAIRIDPLAEQNGRRLLGLAPFAMIGGAVPERRASTDPSRDKEPIRA